MLNPISPPAILPVGLVDVGAQTNQPFVIVAAGQSNQVGQDYGGNFSGTGAISGTVLTISAVTTGFLVAGVPLTGAASGTTVVKQIGGVPGGVGTYTVNISQTLAATTLTAPKGVGHGIYCTNNYTAPTALVPVAFGTAPLNLTVGGTTTDPNLSYNAQAVQTANYLRAYLDANGQANRDIVIIFDCAGGQSITDWIDASPPLNMWSVLTTGLSLVSTAYPQGYTINLFLWDQGENDSSGTYGSQSLYAAGFARLVTEVTALPQWSVDSRWLNTELGQWNTESQQARNDFLRTTANGQLYPFMSLVSSNGMVASTQNAPAHFDGQSHVRLGLRNFQAYLQGKIRGAYAGQTTYWGSTYAFHNYFAPADNTTLTLGTDDVISGAIIACGNGVTVALPNPAYCFSPITIRCASSVTISTSGNVIYPENTGTQVSSASLYAGGIYTIWPFGGVWYVTSVSERVGSQKDSHQNAAGSAGATTTLGSHQWNCGWFTVSGGSIALSGTFGQRATFYNVAGAGVATISGNTCVAPDGSTSSTYPVSPGSIVEVTCDIYTGSTAAFFITYDSAISSMSSQYVLATSGGTVTCNPSIGHLTCVIDAAATLASLTISLPTNPKNGNKVSFVSTQAVTAVTWTNGTLGVAQASFTAGQRVTLSYSSSQSKWY